MSEYKMGMLESRFADIIWQNEPLPSGRLAKLAEAELNWKRTTSYTILKRLCDRGLFQNINGTVTSIISRDEFYARKSEEFVNDTFDGSVAAFLAAFGTRKKITQDEADELRRVLDELTK